MRCSAGGAVESPLMPHQESLAMAQELDTLREIAGVRPAPEPTPAVAEGSDR
ncbi:MAG: hypothetical protein KGL43_02315 [Burkholderiales bacterium]|nr:hypothetical protein [Burkholderiales bacterium]